MNKCIHCGHKGEDINVYDYYHGGDIKRGVFMCDNIGECLLRRARLGDKSKGGNRYEVRTMRGR